MRPRPELIAHRGAPRERLENTLASFAAALAHGADGVELDVHFTRDHVPVVHHDATLGPTAGRRAGWPIAVLDSVEILAIELAPGVTIPTLRDVRDLVAGRATLYVEIKGAATDAELTVVHNILHACAGYALHSFDHDVARRSAALVPDVACGILREHDRSDPAAALRRARARDLWQHWSVIDAALVASVHEAGGRVIAWTVNDADAMRQLAAYGVDGLCTDDVPIARTALAALDRAPAPSTRVRPAP